MSNLALSFSEIFTEVSEFLGTGASPTGTALALVKKLTYRGYRKFLFPKFVRTGRAHTWSFLRQDGVINMTPDKWEFPLPEDFSWFWYPPQFGEQSYWPSPLPVSMKTIMSLRSSIPVSSYPQYWSLNTMKYDVSVGTRYQISVHPPSNQIYTLHFGYIIEPDKPTADGEYFVGGADSSECILECALAEAEANDNDMKTSHHNDRAKDMLHTCIERDLRRAPITTSSFHTGTTYWGSPVLARELRWVSAATTAYGQSLS